MVTRGLIDAAALPASEFGRRAEALSKNRQLWMVLAADCGIEGNALPKPLRAQIISLSIFVDRHTTSVLRDGASMDVLVEINRAVMQGLAPAGTPSIAGQ
jgi:flagellar protein FlaF